MSQSSHRRDTSRGTVVGNVATAVVLCSVGVIAAIALLGPSKTVVHLPDNPPPPLFIRHPLPDAVEYLMVAGALVLGTAGMVTALFALRQGWRPRPARMLLWGGCAAALLAIVPPMGSHDTLLYAEYGRILALGNNPYVMTPNELRELNDPIALWGSPHWQWFPAFYGPVSIALDGLASWLGGSSMNLTVFWLKVEALCAFLGTALLLDRLARPDVQRQVRMHLLWTLNPLVLWTAVAGGHNDVVGVFMVVAAFAVVRRWGRFGAGAGVGAGLLLGIAGAVKVPLLGVGAGFAWVRRRRLLDLAGLAMGATAALGAAYLLAGGQAVKVLADHAGDSGESSLWELVPGFGSEGPVASPSAVRLGMVLMALLVIVLWWRLPAERPPTPPGARVAFALLLAWTMTTPAYRPWYDIVTFALLALLPAGWFDWALPGRVVAALLLYLPGIGPEVYDEVWLTNLRTFIHDWLTPGAALVFVCLVLGWAIGGASRELWRRSSAPSDSASGTVPDSAHLTS